MLDQHPLLHAGLGLALLLVVALVLGRAARFVILRMTTLLQAWNQALGNVASLSANRRRMTNLGTFRAYALAYLKSHPDMTYMVRQMEATAQGVPLEIYWFTRTTAWDDYERIQGDIFDYLLAVMPEFGLNLYQQPSGMDLRAGLLGGSKVS